MKDYWYICSTRNYEITRVIMDDGTDFDRVQKDKEIGNYFETLEEAEKAVEKLKAWKRLKDKGSTILGWSIFGSEKGAYKTVYIKLSIGGDFSLSRTDIDSLFGGEE